MPKKAAPEKPGRAESLPWQAAALLLLALIAYWNSLDGSFHFDDFVLFSDPDITGPGFGWAILRLGQTRPLTYLTFHWNYALGATDPAGYHWVNLLLHAANSVLVLLLARRHLKSLAAFLAAALFALHPLQTQAVDYIFARSSLLAVFFALLSFWLFLKERHAWSVAAFALSLLAKEETAALPVFFLLYDLLWKRRRPRSGYYAAMFGLVVLVGARLFYVLHTIAEPGVGFRVKEMPALAYALTQARVIWIYIRLFLFPVGLNLDHQVALSRGLLTPPSTLPALLALAALIGISVWMVWRQKPLGLWLLGFLLFLAPSSSVIPVADVIFEHRMYFPLACLVIAAAGLLERLPRRAWVVGLPVLIAALLVGTISRNRTWRDEKSLWADVIQKSPNKPRAYRNLARAFWADDLGYSRQLLERGLELDPNNADMHSDMGITLMLQSEPKEALLHFQKAMISSGPNSDLWNNIGAAHLRLGETSRAVESYGQALKLDPCSFASRKNLMQALAQTADRQAALAASQLPPNCRLTPEEAAKLEDLRRALR